MPSNLGGGQMFRPPWSLCRAEFHASARGGKAVKAESYPIFRAMLKSAKAIAAEIISPIIKASWHMCRLQEHVTGMRPFSHQLNILRCM